MRAAVVKKHGKQPALMFRLTACFALPIILSACGSSSPSKSEAIEALANVKDPRHQSSTDWIAETFFSTPDASSAALKNAAVGSLRGCDRYRDEKEKACRAGILDNAPWQLAHMECRSGAALDRMGRNYICKMTFKLKNADAGNDVFIYFAHSTLGWNAELVDSWMGLE